MDRMVPAGFSWHFAAFLAAFFAGNLVKAKTRNPVIISGLVGRELKQAEKRASRACVARTLISGHEKDVRLGVNISSRGTDVGRAAVRSHF